jgi:hypothetical protein
MYLNKSVNNENKKNVQNVQNKQNEENVENIDYYSNLCKLNKLFLDKNFKNMISSKATADSIRQNLIYYKNDNVTERYTINIINSRDIKITIPLKNCNYTYSTNFSSIIDIIKYLKLHL